jgi:hypothetical protein
MTRPEAKQEIVVRQDAFGLGIGGKDWVGIGSPRVHVFREKERRPRSPLSFTRLNEFLDCPACYQVRAEGRGFRMPETEGMLVSSVLCDEVAYSHTPIDREKNWFREPGTLRSYIKNHYLDRLKNSELGGRVFDYLRRRREEKKQQLWKNEKERDRETLGFIMEATVEAMVRYYLINYWTIIESQQRLVAFELEEGIPMTVMIDQIRKIPIGDLKEKTDGKKRAFKRQIFCLKMRVGEDRLRLSLQTGVQLLAYQSLNPGGKLPEIVVYDFATGRKLVRRGGDEDLLIEGIVCARRAMDLGFNESNPYHKHYDQLRGRGVKFDMINEEGRRWYEAARQAFEAYDKSCEWEEVPTPVLVRRENGGFIIHPLKGNCRDCGSMLQMDLNGAIYCSTEGKERRFGKFPKDAVEIGLGGYLSDE